MKDISEATFKELVHPKQTRPLVVEFYSTWCSPCKAMVPMLEKLAQEHTEYSFAKMNVETCGRTSAQYGVASVPTIIVFNGGGPIGGHVGRASKEQVLDLIHDAVE